MAAEELQRLRPEKSNSNDFAMAAATCTEKRAAASSEASLLLPPPPPSKTLVGLEHHPFVCPAPPSAPSRRGTAEAAGHFLLRAAWAVCRYLIFLALALTVCALFVLFTTTGSFWNSFRLLSLYFKVVIAWVRVAWADGEDPVLFFITDCKRGDCGVRLGPFFF